MPPMIVAAERDTPGIRASVWMQPISRAWRSEIGTSSPELAGRARRSVSQHHNPACNQGQSYDGRREERGLDPVP